MKTRDIDMIDTWAARPDAFEFEPEAVKAQYRDYVEARIEELAGGPAKETTKAEKKSKKATTEYTERETGDNARDLTDEQGATPTSI